MLKISVHSASQDTTQDTSAPKPLSRVLQSSLMFKVAAHLYAVNLLQIREVRTTSLMTRVAHAPPYVLGVTSIRGEIVPVIDLKERFNLDRSSTGSRQSLVLISEVDDRKVGIQVDSVLEVIDIDMATVQPVPRTTMSIDLRYLTGMTQVEGEIVLLVDLQKILQPDELHAIAMATQEAALA